jgi:hypothetical protein
VLALSLAAFPLSMAAGCGGSRPAGPAVADPVAGAPATGDDSGGGATIAPDSLVISPGGSAPGPKAPPAGTTSLPEPSLRAADLIGGYRVQVFTSGGLPEAESVRNALREAGLPAYVEYHAPLYRVRLGDCTDPAEARELRERAVAMGYDRAVVVPTLIRASGRSPQPVSLR